MWQAQITKHPVDHGEQHGIILSAVRSLWRLLGEVVHLLYCTFTLLKDDSKGTEENELLKSRVGVIPVRRLLENK